MLTDKVKDMLINTVFTIACLFLVYTFFVWFPFSLYYEGECLEKGYPTVNVTVGLEAYCKTQEGLIQPKVVKLNAD